MKDADPFESTELFTRRFADLSFVVAGALIKIRLLLDVKALRDSTVLGEKVPQEVHDNIRGQPVSSIVAGRKDIMESKDLTELIEKLESQVEEIYKAVAALNEFMWPALLRPGKNLTAKLLGYAMGTPAHMRIVLRYSYASWVETPGAIDMIRDLSKKHSNN